MSSAATQPVIFISHATADDALVTRLHDTLEAALGCSCWADHLDITPGMEWQQEITQALAACAAMIVSISRASASRIEVIAEWRDALDQGKPLFVAIIDDIPHPEIPYRLRQIQYVNLHTDWDGGLARLIAAINAELGTGTRSIAPAQRQHSALSAMLYQNSGRVLDAPDQLIGRDDLLATIMSQIEQHQRILLHGFGGEGKTALAATLAQQWLEMDRGPVLWLQAGSSDADTIFEALVAPLNAQQAIAGQSGDAKLMAVRRGIAATSTHLVVLDDVWNGQALAQVLRAMPPEAAVVITSRSRYPIPLQHSIGGLDADCARELLSHYAGQDLSNAPEVNELAADLGYHAYALEIAARTMLADQLTPADLRVRIANAPHALIMPEFFAQAGRESISALLQVSLNALDAETRAVFAAFGAFTAPALTTELLALYLGAEPVNRLDTLVRRGLVERLAADDQNVAMVRVHGLAHSYARMTVTAEQQGQALDACLAYMTRYNTPSLNNFKALRPVLPVLLGAAEIAVVLERDAAVEQFAWDLYRGSQILDLGGFFAQATRVLYLASEAAAKQSNEENESAHLGHLGLVYRVLGQYDQAIKYHEAALVIARRCKNRIDEGTILGNLGLVYRSLGQYDRAIKYHEAALVIAQEIPDQLGVGNQLGNLGNVYMDLGQYNQAIKYHEESLAIKRKIQNRRGESASLGGLGNAYAALGQVVRAIEYYEQSLAIAREIGDRRGEGVDLGNLGNAYVDLGEISRAIEYYEQSLVIAREIRDRNGESTQLGNLGIIFRTLGQYDRAIENFAAVLVIAREIGDRRGEGATLGNLGLIYADQGQLPQAIEHYEQSLAIAREIGDRRGEGATLGNLGLAYGALGDVAQAIKHHEQALVISREIGNRRGEGADLGNLGIAYAVLGELARAIEYYEQSLAIAREIGDRRGEGSHLGNLGNAYADLGEVSRAIEYYEQSLAILTVTGAAPLVEHMAGLLADARAQFAGDNGDE